MSSSIISLFSFSEIAGIARLGALMISDSCFKLGKGGDGPVRLSEVHIIVALLLATVLRLTFYQSNFQLALKLLLTVQSRAIFLHEAI